MDGKLIREKEFYLTGHCFSCISVRDIAAGSVTGPFDNVKDALKALNTDKV